MSRKLRHVHAIILFAKEKFKIFLNTNFLFLASSTPSPKYNNMFLANFMAASLSIWRPRTAQGSWLSSTSINSGSFWIFTLKLSSWERLVTRVASFFLLRPNCPYIWKLKIFWNQSMPKVYNWLPIFYFLKGGVRCQNKYFQKNFLEKLPR